MALQYLGGQKGEEVRKKEEMEEEEKEEKEEEDEEEDCVSTKLIRVTRESGLAGWVSLSSTDGCREPSAAAGKGAFRLDAVEDCGTGGG